MTIFMDTTYLLKLSRAKQVVCVSQSKELFRSGIIDDIHVLQNASIVVGNDGRIVKIGPA